MKLLFAVLLIALPASAQSSGQLVRMHTNAGDIDVQLLPATAPLTVQNFLNYMNRGAYDNSIFHRSVKNFIIQGGGFKQDFSAIPQDAAVVNEYSLSNTRGTISMAKLESDPNSATNQWFFNLGDNSATLDNQNGGFTVFGRVANPASLAVMDKIGALPIASNFLALPFNAIPIFSFANDVSGNNLVTVISVTQLNSVDAPVIQGVISASAFGGSTTTAPGSYIEIYGQNLAGTSRGWATADFKNGNAPTQLDGVAVSVGGRNAYVNYVSPGQVNVQLSPSLAAGGQPVIVTFNGQANAASDAASINIMPLAAGILAPPSFLVNGRQYAAAFHLSGAAVSSPKLPNVPGSPAQAGEFLTFYGVGFGPVTPNSVVFAGAIASSAAKVNASVQFKIGGTDAPVAFAGLVPGLVGVYQFNVTVPSNAAATSDLTVEVDVNGSALPQTLFLPGQ